MFDFGTFDVRTFDQRGASSVTAKVGAPASFFTGKRKRWWEELQEEYQAQYAREDRLNASKSKKAVVARKAIKRIAEDARDDGLLTELNAAPFVKLMIDAQYAQRLDETLHFAKQAMQYLEMLREQDEEDTLLLLM